MDYPGLQGDAPALKQVAVFDYLVNNADRKASHFLKDKNGKLWLVDHGLTFNSIPKLRTVLWNFAGQPIPEDLLASVKLLKARLKQDLHLRKTLLQLLREDEVEAFEFRIETIIHERVFARPGPHRSVPWPWM